MQQRLNFRTADFPVPVVTASLKSISEEDFAALGAGQVIFMRPITGEELTDFIPDAQIAPPQAEFQMIMSADGAPVLVTDSDDVLADWLEDHDVTLVQRH